jgi:hypothetical protein
MVLYVNTYVHAHAWTGHAPCPVCRTKKTLSALPLLTVNAGPRDGDKWKDRLKEVLCVRARVHVLS